jgi:cytochrome P450
MHAVDEETGERMSDEQLRDEAMTIFVAGHETTANVLAWTLYLVATHPDVEAKLRAEMATTDDVMRMPYVEAVLKESMRLFPPAWILARRVENDETVAGHQFHRGEFLFMSQYVVHRHPRLWKDADRFIPQRFIDVPEPTPRYAYFPFSGGARKCIGDVFAQMEAKILLVEIMKRVTLKLAPGARIVPEPVVTLRPRYGVPMIATDVNA